MNATIDHLLYASHDLETGVADIERMLGVRPSYGGRHLGLGTHNALISLGPRTYLEVIAPDPAQAGNGAVLPYGIATLQEPALRAWAAAPSTIGEAVRKARALGLDFGEVTAHSRRASDGSDVRWEMATRATSDGDIAVVPFLIDWGTTVHPAERSPRGSRLSELRLFSPDPGLLERELRAIGVGAGGAVSIGPARSPGLEAVLVDRAGREVILRS